MKYLELGNRLNALYGDFNYFVINDKCEIVKGGGIGPICPVELKK